MILKIFVSGSFDTNSMLLVCEETKKAAAIDPAFGCSEKILSFASSNNFEIEYILLTHSHFDHVGEISKIKKKTKAKVLIHKLEAPFLENPGLDNLPIFRKVEAIKPDILLEDKDKIRLGKLEIEVIHTPGHTPGSCCYYIPSEKTLLSGDTLFAGSMGNVSFPTSLPDEMYISLKKLSFLPPDTMVYPGHGPTTSIGDEPWISDSRKKFNY